MLLALGVATLVISAQALGPAWRYAVQLTATVQAASPRITLHWPTDSIHGQSHPAPSEYKIYRKTPGATSWGSEIATLSGTATSYPDTSAQAGLTYEYKVVKNHGSFSGYGYIHAAFEAPLQDYRGKVILVTGLTPTQRTNLQSELQRLERDLTGDGWTVVRIDKEPTDSVGNVKAAIDTAYATNPVNPTALFLFGHVPVPYSGIFPGTHPGGAPDGHNGGIAGDHRGAWPADVYYGVMGASWTDDLEHTSSDFPQNRNSDNDGKFDQTLIPGVVELQIGRVDLANMPGNDADGPGWPAFGEDETGLLRRYLNKDHAYRHRAGVFANLQQRAIISDHMGEADGNAYAAAAYRGFAPLVGTTGSAITPGDTPGWWGATVDNNDYLFSYVCSLGSRRSVAYAGATTGDNTLWHSEVHSNDVRVVFSFLFGSWFGDWDTVNWVGNSNNLMRAFLATPSYGLAAAWLGRPHWFIHPLGLGETLGYCARLTQNNAADDSNPLYKVHLNQHANKVHIALMGDPTLRLYGVKPVLNVAATPSGGTTTVTWSAPIGESLVGYHVYRATTGPFTRLTTSLHTTTSYPDVGAPTGAIYMVRAVKLQVTPSGSFYNASQGVYSDACTETVAPNTPAGLDAVAVSSSQINLSWSDTSSNETAFAIERSLDGSNFAPIDSVGANTTTYQNTGLSASTTYHYRVRAVNCFGNSAYSGLDSATTSGGGSSSWTGQDIGAVGTAGSHSESGGTFTVQASGADIWGTADEFRFVHQQVADDGTIIARVASLSNTNSWAKAGVMIRDGLSADAAHVMVQVTPGNGVIFQRRTTAGGSCAQDWGPGLAAPVWVKLTRTGNSFSASYSQNGTSWTPVGSAVTVSMGATVYAGLAATSHNDGVLTTATFDNVDVDFSGAATWTSQDIGAVGAPGSGDESGGTFTLEASGADIWGTADEFHFVHQQVTDDATIIARVASLENTNAWAKAGVMFRNGLSADAAHVMVQVTPGNGVIFQRRTTAGGSCAQDWGPGLAAPVWVKLTRTGNSFSAYYSQNGTSWTPVGSTVTVSMNSTINAGLAATSHNDGVLATATFDGVDVSTP